MKVHTNDALRGMPNFLIWKVAQVVTLWHARAGLHFQQKTEEKGGEKRTGPYIQHRGFL